MKLIEKILLPISFSQSHETFIKSVKSIAKKHESEIVLINSLKESIRQKPYADKIKQIVEDKLITIHKDLTNANIKVKLPQILFGNAFDNIINCARTEKVNAVLIASNFESTEENEKLSPISEKLIRKAECPVWVIKNGKELKINSILCPVDFSNPSIRALRNAIYLSKSNNARLIILSIIEPLLEFVFKNEVDYSGESEKHRIESEQKISKLISDINLSGINHKIQVFVGQPSKAIINEIKNNNIDLLVIGTTGKTNLGKILIGSVTEKIIREMPCSVITTKSTDIINLRLENEIKDIEELTKIATELERNEFIEDAIEQFELCLRINDMHIPSYYRIANLLNRLGRTTEAKEYKNMVSELIVRLWDKTIETDFKNHFLKLS